MGRVTRRKIPLQAGRIRHVKVEIAIGTVSHYSSLISICDPPVYDWFHFFGFLSFGPCSSHLSVHFYALVEL